MSAIANGPQFPWARDMHFSQSVRTDDLVVASGQAGFEPQPRQAFRNLDRVLHEQGSSLDGVLRLYTYLSDASQYAAFKAIRAEFLRAPYPASTAVVIGCVFPGMLCEIDAIAARGAIREPEPASRPEPGGAGGAGG